MKNKIKEYLKDQFLINFDENLTEETDLFKNRIIDSHGYIEILNYLEKEFSIKLTEEEMFSNVLVSLANMAEFIEQKQRSR